VNLAEDSVASLVASYLEAVGTIAAVVVALFLQVILVRMRRPRLHVTLSLHKEDGNVEAWRRRDGVVNCWLGVRVHAGRGRDAATHVRAYLVKVVRPEGERDAGAFPSASLDWANVDSEHLTIPAGSSRQLTLLRYAAADGERSEFLMPTTTLPLRTDHARYLLGADGHYKIVFELSADGVDPSFWALEFDHVIRPVEDDRDLLLDRLDNVQCVKKTADEVRNL
jgi:hypothetical protein